MARKIKQIEMKMSMRPHKKVEKKKAKKSIKPIVVATIISLALLGVVVFAIIKMVQS